MHLCQQTSISVSELYPNSYLPVCFPFSKSMLGRSEQLQASPLEAVTFDTLAFLLTRQPGILSTNPLDLKSLHLGCVTFRIELRKGCIDFTQLTELDQSQPRLPSQLRAKPANRPRNLRVELKDPRMDQAGNWGSLSNPHDRLGDSTCQLCFMNIPLSFSPAPWRAAGQTADSRSPVTLGRSASILIVQLNDRPHKKPPR